MVMKTKYNPKQYLELVETINDSILRNFMSDEADFINKIIKEDKYHVIDLGSGYGRIIPKIIGNCEKITAIEIDNNMFYALAENFKDWEKVTTVHNDMTLLSNYLTLSKRRNLFILCQNTLGVIEGDYKNLIKELKKISKDEGRIEILFSVFNSDALETYGIYLYDILAEMVGKIDYSESKLSEGLFVSEIGYNSKWWSEFEINTIIDDLKAKIISLKKTNIYSMYHLSI